MSTILESPDESRPDDRDMRIGFKLSLAFHVLLVAFIAIKSLVLPSEPIAIPPVLRVDIVGLPDILKKDKAFIPPKTGGEDLAEQLKEAEEQANSVKPLPPIKAPPKPVEEVAKPEEMVVKPKVASKAQAEKLKAEAERRKLEDARKTRESRMKNALSRLKSLSKIQAEGESSPVVKGNKVSAGSSMSDDARESGEASYYDALREHLQQNWALPVWLARQKLAAQVILYIDSRGQMRNVVFLKSSGNPRFDEQVRRTLQQSQPFPIPPRDVAASVLSSGVRIHFPL